MYEEIFDTTDLRGEKIISLPILKTQFRLTTTPDVWDKNINQEV